MEKKFEENMGKKKKPKIREAIWFGYIYFTKKLKLIFLRKIHYILILFFVLLSTINVVDAHSVQVQYCINCNGDLRIWLEHWHGTASPNSTSMTISIDINGTSTTQTSAPGGGVVNVPSGSLPGCSTPITYVTGCSGKENTYNDWVFYDFTGLPQGVPVSFTIISGNTVFTEDGCNMYPLQVDITIDAVTVSDQNLCDGAPTTLVAMTSWTNSNPSIGLPASGTGNIPSFTPIGGPGTSATISFANACSTGSFVYTVVPSPITGFASASNNVSTNTICLGSAFDFTNTTTIDAPYTISSYLWDFGDGVGTSALQNPSYTYAADGTYTVSLTATSDSGCVIVATQDVVVNPFPVTSFTVSDTCAYNTSVFTNTTTIVNGIIASWEWNFDDGNTSTQQNPTNAYTNYGIYYPSLIATTDIGCVDTFTLSTGVIIFEVPQSNFMSNDVCVYNQGVFTDLTIMATDPITWTWDFGDGNNSTLQNSTNLYAAEGTYNVELLVTSSNGCVDSITQPIVIHPKPVALFTITDDCFYNDIIITDGSTVTTGFIPNWDWDLGDGTTSTTQNNTYGYLSDGAYNVTLIVTTDNNCTDTITLPTIVFPVPNVNFTAPPVCLYDSAVFTDFTTINAPDSITSWLWSFGDGTPIVSNQNETHLFASEGTYNINLIVTSNNGCVSQLIAPITIYPIPVPYFTSTSVCVNTPATGFTDLTNIAFGIIDFWNWDFIDGNTSNLQNPSNPYIIDGTYNVQLTVTSDFGCIEDTILPVIVYEKPIALFTSNIDEGCNPVSIDFIDISTSTTANVIDWQWDLGNGSSSTDQNTSTVYTNSSNTDNEFYDVELMVMNDLGCYDTLLIANYITVWPTPVAEFDPNPYSTNMYETGVNMVNNSIGGATYDWDLDDNATSVDYQPFHAYSDTGTYFVTLITTSQYFCVDSITKPLEITAVVNIYVPNAFTPNGDGINDDFFFKGFAVVENRFNFYVFDRWGELVYETHDFIPWDGMHKGRPAKQDVYVWKLKARDVFGETHVYTGHVNLLR